MSWWAAGCAARPVIGRPRALPMSAGRVLSDPPQPEGWQPARRATLAHPWPPRPALRGQAAASAAQSPSRPPARPPTESGHARRHQPVSDPADLGALDIELAGDRGPEPPDDLTPGHRVLLEAKCRHGQAVQHVLRMQLVVIEAIDLQVQRIHRANVVGGVELAVWSRVDEGPRPLLRDDADSFVGGREIHLHVGPHPKRRHDDDDVEDEHEIVRVGHPLRLALLLPGDISGLHAGTRAELDDEPDQDELGGQEEGSDDDGDQQDEAVDIGRVRRRLRDEPGNHERSLMKPAGRP